MDNPNEAYRLPALATAALQEVRARGITLEKVSVNVELLTPSRLPSEGSDVPVLGLCSGDGLGFPTFGSPQHRSQLKADFSALADLPGLTEVTVGVEMNALYHSGEQGEFGFDYSNYVTVYHEIYRQLNPRMPMFEWDLVSVIVFFTSKPFPTPRQVLQLEDCCGGCVLGADNADAIYEAYRLVIEPLLTAGPKGMPETVLTSLIGA